MTEKGGVEFATFSANGKQGPAALTNNKQENVNHIQADNVIHRRGVCIKCKKNKNICFLKEGHLKNIKTCRDPYFGLDLSKHVNKYPIHLVTQSL